MMKLKWLGIVVLLTVIISSNGLSETIARWQGAPAGDANRPAGSGSWKDAYWVPGPTIPPAPATNADELKLTEQGAVCTVDSNAGNYVCKFSISGGSDKANMPKLQIVEGGYLGIGEFRIGAGGSAKNGTMGCVNQTGGTLCLADDLKLGRSSTSQKNPNDGKGFYTISGGTITYKTGNPKGALCIGGNGTGDSISEGTFTVSGNKAVITCKRLHVGNDGSRAKGSGTLEFQIGEQGVSPIQVANAVYLDQGGPTSTAKLIVNALAAPPKADIVLVENQGSNPINGTFDTVNDKSASNGTEVVLSFENVNFCYTLTYTGGAGSNNIMLLFKTSAPAAPAKTGP